MVKWFNLEKGYGFVTPVEGNKDALLHRSVLSDAGMESLPERAQVVCDVAESRRGWQVVSIYEVDLSQVSTQESEPDGAVQEGSVKFFNGSKGFGFVTPDQGNQDVFVSSKILERSGVMDLEPDQRVRMTVRQSPRGPQATNIETI